MASFFFHPYYDVSYLQQIVQGIQALGYTFVSPQTLLGAGQSVSVPVTVTTTSLPAATAGQAYSATVTAADGTAPYKWSVTSGSLPAGLSLNASTGAITGTPTSAATSTVTVAATDSTTTPSVGTTAGSTVLTPAPQQATATLTLTVNPSTFGISTASLPSGTVNQPYTAALAAAGGTSPVCLVGHRVAEGPQPQPGYRGDQRAAHHGGTVHGEDSGERLVPTRPLRAAATLTLTVNPKMVITASSLPAGTVGQSYSAALSASGGAAPYTWAVTSGSLPAGLTLDPNSGAITGTPTAAASSSVTVTATDSSTPNQGSVSKTFTLTVKAAKLQITTASLPSGTVNQPYSARRVRDWRHSCPMSGRRPSCRRVSPSTPRPER